MYLFIQQKYKVVIVIYSDLLTICNSYIENLVIKQQLFDFGGICQERFIIPRLIFSSPIEEKLSLESGLLLQKPSQSLSPGSLIMKP